MFVSSVVLRGVKTDRHTDKIALYILNATSDFVLSAFKVKSFETNGDTNPKLGIFIITPIRGVIRR